LRSLVEAHEQELMRLRTTNEELRRQVAVFGDSYVRFAASCVSHLQHVGQAMQEMDRVALASPELRAG